MVTHYQLNPGADVQFATAQVEVSRALTSNAEYVGAEIYAGASDAQQTVVNCALPGIATVPGLGHDAVEAHGGRRRQHRDRKRLGRRRRVVHSAGAQRLLQGAHL